MLEPLLLAPDAGVQVELLDDIDYRSQVVVKLGGILFVHHRRSIPGLEQVSLVGDGHVDGRADEREPDLLVGFLLEIEQPPHEACREDVPGFYLIGTVHVELPVELPVFRFNRLLQAILFPVD